ncbi:MAG: MFS transporter [Gemmataceae bacterium]|nr:MFS transporter [Gemmataceae bacterium]
MENSNGLYTADNPFKFLEYFEESEADLFAGRDREVREAMAGVTSGSTFVLHGRGGIGKTSFLLAGLFPTMRSLGFRPIYVRTLQSPLGDLQAALCEEIANEACTQTNEAGRQTIEACTQTNEACTQTDETLSAEQALVRLSKTQPVILAFDQFEEFFLRFPPDVRADSIREVARLAAIKHVRVRFLFSLREDYLAHMNELRSAYGQLFDNQYRLEPLTAFGAREAIERALVRANVRYDRALLSRLMDVLAKAAGPEGGFDPPLLQILCSELYDDARRRHAQETRSPQQDFRLTERDLESLGGLTGVFRRFLDRGIRNLSQDKTTQSLVRLVIDALITEKRTKIACTMDDLLRSGFEAQRHEVQAVLDALVKQRLLRRDTRRGVDWYELIHERLIDFLLQWLETDAEFFGLRGARQIIQNATALNLWRKQLGLLLGAGALTETIGPFKERLRFDESALEFLFLSALFSRHKDCRFWADRLGRKRANDIVRGILQDDARASQSPDRQNLRLGAAWACGAIPLQDEQLTEKSLAIALDPAAPANLRRAAGESFAALCKSDQCAALPKQLRLQSNWDWFAQVRAGVIAKYHDAVDWLASLAPWRQGETEEHAGPASNATEQPELALDLLAQLSAAQKPLDSFPWTVRWRARFRRRRRLFDDQRGFIEQRQEQGQRRGFQAALVWTLTMGIQFSTSLGWILGKYGYASFLFVSSCVGLALPLGMGLGAWFGRCAAKAAAKNALVQSAESDWGRAVLFSPGLLIVLFGCIWAGVFNVLLLASEFEWSTEIAEALGVALLWAVPVFLVLAVVLAGMVGLSRSLISETRRARTAIWVTVGNLGLPHWIALGFFLLGGALFEKAAWWAASFIGIFLSFALFVLTLALERSARKEPAACTAQPRIRPWVVRSAALVLAVSSVWLFGMCYGWDTQPFFRSYNLDSEAELVFEGRNEGEFDSDVFPLVTSSLMVVECTKEKKTGTTRFYLGGEEARFEREERQLYLLPPGTHHAYVQKGHADGYHFRLTQPTWLRENDRTLDHTEETYDWCMCTWDEVSRTWRGQMQFNIPKKELSAYPFLDICVGRDFLGFPKEKLAVLDGELARDEGEKLIDVRTTSAGVRTAAPDNRWTVLVHDLSSQGVRPASLTMIPEMQSRVSIAARIDFPARANPTSTVRIPASGELFFEFTLSSHQSMARVSYENVALLVSFRLQQNPAGAPLRDVITKEDAFHQKPTNLRYKSYPKYLKANKEHFVSLRTGAFTPTLAWTDGNQKIRYAARDPKRGNESIAWSVFRPEAAGAHNFLVQSKGTGEFQFLACPLSHDSLPVTLVRAKASRPCWEHELTTEKNCRYRFKVFARDASAERPKEDVDGRGRPRLRDFPGEIILENSQGIPVFTSGKERVAADDAVVGPKPERELTGGDTSYFSGKAEKLRLIVASMEGALGDFEVHVERERLVFARQGRLEDHSETDKDLKHFAEFNFRMSAKKKYVVDLICPNKSLDPYLVLRVPTLRNPLENDDGGGNFNSRVVFTSNETQEVVIRATSYKPREHGPFALHVWEEDTSFIEPGTVTGKKRYSAPSSLTFNAADGQSLVLRVAQPAGQAAGYYQPTERVRLAVADEHRTQFAEVIDENPRILLENAKGSYRLHVSPVKFAAGLTIQALQIPLQGPKLDRLEPTDPFYPLPSELHCKKYKLPLEGNRYYQFQFKNPEWLVDFQLTDGQGRLLRHDRRSFFFVPYADADYRLVAFVDKPKEQWEKQSRDKRIVFDSVPFLLQIVPQSRDLFYRYKISDLHSTKERMIAKENKNHDILIELAWSNCMLGEWKEATDILEELPRSAESTYPLEVRDRYWNAKAWIAYASNDFPAAVLAWTHVSQGFFDFPDAESYESKQKFDDARKRLKSAQP